MLLVLVLTNVIYWVTILALSLVIITLVVVVAEPAILPTNVVAVIIPPTYKLPPMPTPPTTCKAPEFVLVALEVPVKVSVLLKVGALVPLLTNTLPTVPVFTYPVTPGEI